MSEETRKRLNWKEERVVQLLIDAGEPMTLQELRRKAFPGVRPTAKGDSQVRNSLRKPRRLKLVKRVKAGLYRSA